MIHFIWVYTVCQSTRFGVSVFQRFSPKSAKKKMHLKCRLLKSSAANNCLALRIKYRSKQRGPRTDCSYYRSSLIWVHTVCHRGFLNISADEKSRLLLRLTHFESSVVVMVTYLIWRRYCAFWMFSSDPVMVMIRSLDPGKASSMTIWAPDCRLISIILDPPLPIIAPASYET